MSELIAEYALAMSLQFECLADRPEDVPRVIDWWYSVWGDLMGADVAQMRSTLRETELPISILATIGGVLVGSAALK